jgi:hypothetical protein
LGKELESLLKTAEQAESFIEDPSHTAVEEIIPTRDYANRRGVPCNWATWRNSKFFRYLASVAWGKPRTGDSRAARLATYRVARGQAIIPVSLIEISLFNRVTDSLGRSLKRFSQLLKRAVGTDETGHPAAELLWIRWV